MGWAGADGIRKLEWGSRKCEFGKRWVAVGDASCRDVTGDDSGVLSEDNRGAIGQATLGGTGHQPQCYAEA